MTADPDAATTAARTVAWANWIDAHEHTPATRLTVADELEIAFKDGYDAGAARARADTIREHMAERELVHADLAQLLRVLGLGDHARPYSSHEVMLEAINEVGRLRSQLGLSRG